MLNSDDLQRASFKDDEQKSRGDKWVALMSSFIGQISKCLPKPNRDFLIDLID
jgi:hypothetical protein